MRKRTAILCTALCAIANLQVNAQVAVGFRAGASWANMDFPDMDDDQYADLNWETTARAFPSFAVIADLPFTERLSLVPELAFVQRGYAKTGTNTPFYQSVDQHMVLDYVDLNVLVKFHMSQEPVRPHVLLGGTVGKMIGARYIYDEKYGYSAAGSGDVIVPDDLGMETTNVGLCGGAGFTLSVGSTWLIVEGRYQHGLTNIWNDVLLADINGAPIGEVNSFDRSWHFNIGWIIPVGGDDAPDDPTTGPDTE